MSAQRELRAHVVVYLVANAVFVAIWAWSDVSYFWPIWTIVGWGIALAFQAVRANRRRGRARGRG